MNQSKYWNKYYANTKNSPRKLLVKSLKYPHKNNHALDLGAGNLRDTAYLLKKKFKNIDAVDKQKKMRVFAKKFDESRITVFIMPFEKFEFQKKYDIINAQYALPFMKKSDFIKTFSKIKKSLNKSGIITGQFFGVHDTWKNNKNMTFVNIKQARRLLQDLKILYFFEEEKDGSTALGQNKHWHVFHFIAKK